MKIYDCFTFYNEFEVLDIRLRLLWDHVDVFVISEANITHQGNPKKYFLDDYLIKNKNFESKIRRVKVEEFPSTDDPWVIERHQRESLAKGLYDVASNDLIIVSDCDEIPRPDALKLIIKNGNCDRYILATPMFYFKYNYMMIQPRVRQTNIAVVRGSEFRGPQFEREKTFGKEYLPFGYHCKQFCIIEHGGWHFSYIGDNNFVKNKILNFAHSETNKTTLLERIDVEKVISMGRGLDQNSDFEKFVLVNLNEYFPLKELDNASNDHFDKGSTKSSVFDFYDKNTFLKIHERTRLKFATLKKIKYRIKTENSLNNAARLLKTCKIVAREIMNACIKIKC